jgi:hypothetical protein
LSDCHLAFQIMSLIVIYIASLGSGSEASRNTRITVYIGGRNGTSQCMRIEAISFAKREVGITVIQMTFSSLSSSLRGMTMHDMAFIQTINKLICFWKVLRKTCNKCIFIVITVQRLGNPMSLPRYTGSKSCLSRTFVLISS